MTDEENASAEIQETEQPTQTDQEAVEDPIDEPIDLDAVEEQEEEVEAEVAAEAEVEPEVEVEPEFATIEIDGQEYNVPNALKDGYLRNADYTQKTQEVAEQRKELDQRAETLEQQSIASEEELQDRVTVMNLKDRLDKYENADWDAAELEDPAEAQKHWRTFQQLKEQHKEAQGRLDQRTTERTETAERETVTRLQQTLDYAKENIKGWTPEVDTKIGSFAVEELGFTPDTLRGAYNPQVYNALYLAYLGSQSLKSQTNAKPTPQTKPTPLKTVRAKAAPNVKKSYDDMSMDEFAKARNSK